MANPNIYSQFAQPVRSVQDYIGDMDRREGNALEVAMKRMQQQQAQRGMADDDAARQIFAQYGDKARNPLMAAGLSKQAFALDDRDSKRAQDAALLNKTNVETQSAEYGTVEKSLKIAQTFAAQVQDVQGAQSYLRGLYSHPVLGPMVQQVKPLDKALGEIPQDPQQFLQWKAGHMNITADKLISLLTPTVKSVNAGNAHVGNATNNFTGQVIPGTETSTPINQSADSIATQESARLAREQGAENARLTREQAAATLKLQQDKFNWDKNKPVAAAGGAPSAARTGPMSVTMQKELLESDDTVQSAGNVIRTLESALKINDKAYSGYFAKGRAQLASNVIPGQTPGADATIDIDNMMTGQALESLKLIFGGMPTEGERRILLDMQASADKTPTQRKAIIARAIAAAKRRAVYAGGKAKSIRDGTYLTQGAQPMPEDAEAGGALSPENGGKPAAGSPKVGTIEGGYRFKGGNAGDPKNWEKQ